MTSFDGGAFSDVEVVSRLVEQQVVGVLGERPRDQHSLLLTAGQLFVAAAGEVFNARLAQGVNRQGAIEGGVALESGPVRQAAEQHHVGHGQRDPRRRLLRDHADPAGDRALGQRSDWHVVEADQAGPGAKRRIERAQQG